MSLWRSLQDHIFFRAVFLLFISFLLLTANFYFFVLRPTTHKLADASLQAASAQGEIQLRQFFGNIHNVVVELAGLRPNVNFDRKALHDLDHQLVPLMLKEASISRILVSDDSGRTFELSRTDDGTGWLNTLYDPGATRNQHRRDIAWDGLLTKVIDSKAQASDFDGRQRPWYQGAVALTDDAQMYWTEPYLFFTLGKPGITVSTRLTDATGRRHVVALDLLLTDISRFTTRYKIGQRGRLAVLSANGVVLGVPAAADDSVQLDDAALSKLVASPATTLSEPELMPAITQWDRLGEKKQHSVVHYKVGQEAWIADFRDVTQNNRTYLSVSYAPRSEFLPSLWSTLSQLIIGALVVFLLAGFATLMWLNRAPSKP